jgi:ABC-type thiamin/hydroxymethylpyrimidine transport system permease subunit
MKTRESPFFAAIYASAAAGPMFLLSLAAAEAYKFLPQPIPFDPTYLVFLIWLVPAFVVGFIISFVPNAIGAHLLSKAGEVSEAAREPLIWIGAGAAAGFGLALLFRTFQYSDPGTFALVLTSASCAGICRAWTAWDS